MFFHGITSPQPRPRAKYVFKVCLQANKICQINETENATNMQTKAFQEQTFETACIKQENNQTEHATNIQSDRLHRKQYVWMVTLELIKTRLKRTPRAQIVINASVAKKTLFVFWRQQQTITCRSHGCNRAPNSASLFTNLIFNHLKAPDVLLVSLLLLLL